MCRCAWQASITGQPRVTAARDSSGGACAARRAINADSSARAGSTRTIATRVALVGSANASKRACASKVLFPDLAFPSLNPLLLYNFPFCLPLILFCIFLCDVLTFLPPLSLTTPYIKLFRNFSLDLDWVLEFLSLITIAGEFKGFFMYLQTSISRNLIFNHFGKIHNRAILKIFVWKTFTFCVLYWIFLNGLKIFALLSEYLTNPFLDSIKNFYVFQRWF